MQLLRPGRHLRVVWCVLESWSPAWNGVRTTRLGVTREHQLFTITEHQTFRLRCYQSRHQFSLCRSQVAWACIFKVQHFITKQVSLKEIYRNPDSLCQGNQQTPDLSLYVWRSWLMAGNPRDPVRCRVPFPWHNPPRSDNQSKLLNLKASVPAFRTRWSAKAVCRWVTLPSHMHFPNLIRNSAHQNDVEYRPRRSYKMSRVHA